ncbi:MAG TPA: N-acetyltransferase [Terriglobales bacterium]|nr:N-acetyltransferase [Terriglobales bacterium]
MSGLSGAVIRGEQPDDFAAVEAIHTEAFEREDEAGLLRRLRGRAGSISLVAAVDDALVGHILFTPVTLAGHSFAVAPRGLGPMSVVPSRQSQGIGGELIRAGLDECRRRSVPFVVVLGHPDYYPRFGFVAASRFGLRCVWDVPEEVFLVQELVPGVLAGRSGSVEYAPEFAL